MSRAADFVPGYVHPEPREGALYASSAAILRAWRDEGLLLPELVERLAPDAQAYARELLGAPAPVLAPDVTVGRAAEPPLSLSLPAAGAIAAAWVTGCLRPYVSLVHRLTGAEETDYLARLRELAPPPGPRPECWRIALLRWVEGDCAGLVRLAGQHSAAAVTWVEALIGQTAPAVELMIPVGYSFSHPLSDYERRTLARQSALGSTSTVGLTDRPHLAGYLGHCCRSYESIWRLVAKPGADLSAPIGDTVRPVTLSSAPERIERLRPVAPPAHDAAVTVQEPAVSIPKPAVECAERPRLLYGARIPSSVREVRLDGRAVALARVWEIAVGLIPGAVWVRLVDTDRCWVSGIEVTWSDGGVTRSVNAPVDRSPVRADLLNKSADSLNESAVAATSLALF